MAPKLSEILKLSLSERILWAEALWNSIAMESKTYDAIHLNDEQINRLDEIAAEFEANPAIGSSWENVKNRILASGK
jgi:putative addiction module component (TIGR02574 family)